MLSGKHAKIVVITAVLLLTGLYAFPAFSESRMKENYEVQDNGIGVVLNEIYPCSQEGRYLELFNHGSEEMSLEGWSIDNGGSKSISLSGELEPGEILLMDRWDGLFYMNVTGEEIRLLSPSKQVLDSFSYDFSDRNISFSRLPDGGEWYSPPEKTPGESNPLPPVAPVADIQINSLMPVGTSQWEFISIQSSVAGTICLGGWRFSNRRGTWHLPEYSIEPSMEAVISPDPVSYEMQTGISPDMTPTEGTMVLGDRGDGVFLFDNWGRLADAVWYGDVEPSMGWTGPPAHIPARGEVMYRHGNTNTSLDWPPLFYSKVGTTRLQGGMHIATSSRFFVTPDYGKEALTSVIQGASASISLTVYQFTLLEAAEALADAAQRGVDVKVLVDGNPVGWSWPDEEGEGTGEALDELYLLSIVEESGGEVRFMADDGSTQRGKRYRFNHAKYVVTDPGENGHVMLSTENWKPSGFSRPQGNRGWGVSFYSESMSLQMQELFEKDWQGIGDIWVLGQGHFIPPSTYDPWEIEDAYRYQYHPPLEVDESIDVRLVIGPEENFIHCGVLGLIENASSTINVQLLSLAIEWRIADGIVNPYVEALLRAAERGVEVKILLDPTYVNMSSAADNYDAVLWLTNASRGLPLEARLADTDTIGVSKIHTKGMIVDGEAVLISSLNWNANSMLRNREVGVIVYSEAAGEYFDQVFNWDWSAGRVDTSGNENLSGRNWRQKSVYISISATLIIVVLLIVRRRQYIGIKGNQDEWDDF